MQEAGAGPGSGDEPGDLPDTAATAVPADPADTVESFDAGNIAHTGGVTDQGSTAGPVGQPGIGGSVPSAGLADQIVSVGPAPSFEPVAEWHGPDPRVHRRVPRSVNIASILLVILWAINAVDLVVALTRAHSGDADGSPIGMRVGFLVLYGVSIAFLRRGHWWARGCLVVVASIWALFGAVAVVIAAIPSLRAYDTVGRIKLVVYVLLVLGVLRYLFHPETRAYVSGGSQLHR